MTGSIGYRTGKCTCGTGDICHHAIEEFLQRHREYDLGSPPGKEAEEDEEDVQEQQQQQRRRRSGVLGSNLFAKRIKVLMEPGNVEELRKSLEAYLHPSTLAFLQSKSEEANGKKAVEAPHGSSFLASGLGGGQRILSAVWKRINVFHALEWAQQNFSSSSDSSVQKQESLSQSRRASWDRGTLVAPSPQADETLLPLDQIPPSPAALPGMIPFLDESVLLPIHKAELRCSPELFFKLLLSHESSFIPRFRESRKDTELQMEAWRPADSHRGRRREITFRAVCSTPMCPPSSAMTEWQHAYFDQSHRVLVVETIQQAHDVPFGSVFEVHAQWRVTSTAASLSDVEVSMGVHFKKSCLLKGSIRSSASQMYKQDVLLFLELAEREIEGFQASHLHPLEPDVSSEASLEGMESAPCQKGGTPAEDAEAPTNEEPPTGLNSVFTTMRSYARWPPAVPVPSCVIMPLPFELRQKWKRSGSMKRRKSSDEHRKSSESRRTSVEMLA